jgi:gluconokinase
MTSPSGGPLVLAVDIGTSSVRALAFDASGRIITRRQIPYGTLRPRPYFEEQDPDLVRSEVYRAMRDLIGSGKAAPASICAIAFSSQMYGIFPVDGKGRALGNNILWSDGRAEAQAERMKRELGSLALYPETGCPMNSIYPVAKLSWLREEEPELFGKAARFVSIKEYVTAPLVGEWTVDYSMASATGMLDIRRHVWHSEALAAAGLMPDRLSRPASGLERFALCGDSPLAGLGLPEGLPVFLGGGDGPLANLGSGASGVGAINIDLGTSGAARAICDAAVTDATASLWCFCLTDDLWAYGGIVTNVGNAYQWLGLQVLGVASPGGKGSGGDEAFEQMNRLAEAVEPGSAQLLFLPYLRKARSPYWDGRLKGTIYGLTADHDAGHIARALLEAVAYDLKTIIGLMAAQISVLPHIVFTGGLAKSPILPQLLADVLGRELRTPEDSEGSVAGAAIMGLYGIGALTGLAFKGGPRNYRSFLPDAGRAFLYGRSYERYGRLVAALREIDLDLPEADSR